MGVGEAAKSGRPLGGYLSTPSREPMLIFFLLIPAFHWTIFNPNRCLFRRERIPQRRCPHPCRVAIGGACTSEGMCSTALRRTARRRRLEDGAPLWDWTLHGVRYDIGRTSLVANTTRDQPLYTNLRCVRLATNLPIGISAAIVTPPSSHLFGIKSAC